jgi:hypothetical protein
MGYTKQCSKCGLELPESEFSLVYPAKQDGRKRPDCKECVRVRTRKYIAGDRKAHAARMKKVRLSSRRQAREYVDAYLRTHPCLDCGESDPVVLDFDHVRGKKVKNLSYMMNAGYRLWRIEEEIKKCEVRCANCHRRAHHKRRIHRVQLSPPAPCYDVRN